MTRIRICKCLPVFFLLLVSRALVSDTATASLQVYSIDVEGGQATLLVSPGGESMLVDTGWPGFEGRDAERIQAAMKLAGVERLDYVLITHYHSDHVGGVAQLADRVKVGA